LPKNMSMGFFDFLFEDNHRRPPRKKKTVPNGKAVHVKDTLTAIEAQETSVKKIHAAVLNPEADEIRLNHFKARSSAPVTEKTGTSVPETSPAMSTAPSQTEIKKPIRDPEWLLQRKKILETASQDLIERIQDKLGEGYAGLYAFDMDSEALYTDRLTPTPLFMVNLKNAIELLEESPLGGPSSLVLKTEKYWIYAFVRDRIVFNIFANRENISEGLIFYILQPINRD